MFEQWRASKKTLWRHADLGLRVFTNDGCSVRWIRASQVRLARTANASINVGCGGVRFIGFGPIDGRRNGGKKRFARKGR
jgi:hypothetical protein